LGISFEGGANGDGVSTDEGELWVGLENDPTKECGQTDWTMMKCHDWIVRWPELHGMSRDRQLQVSMSS
jgi:hypothetical protein